MILGVMGVCCTTPWILLAFLSDPTVQIGMGYWMVSCGFLVFGSLLTILIKNKRESEHVVGGNGG